MLLASELLKPAKTPSFRTQDEFQESKKSDQDPRGSRGERTAPTTEKKPNRGSIFTHSPDSDLIDRVRWKIRQIKQRGSDTNKDQATTPSFTPKMKTETQEKT